MAGFNYAHVGRRTRATSCACSRSPRKSGCPAFPDVPTFKRARLRPGRRRLSRRGGAEVDPRGACASRSRTSSSRSTPNPKFIKKMEDGGFVLTDITYDKMADFMAERRRTTREGAQALGIGAVTDHAGAPHGAARATSRRRADARSTCCSPLVGVVLGTVIGALPGLSATMAVAVLVPFTFTMDPAVGPDRAGRDLHRRDLRRRLRRDPGQHAGHAVGDRHHLRRLPDGASGATAGWR